MGQLLRTNGSVQEVLPADGEVFQLKELYRILECDTIQMIPTNDGRTMIMDEEGKFKPAVDNLRANQLTMGVIALRDTVVGDVLVCTRIEAGYEDDEGV